MSNFDTIVFGKKSFSDLLNDIYKNNKSTEKQISDLILSLKPFINSPGEAIMIVPLIKEYMDVKVKNDEHLVKMASVIQRAITSTGRGGEDGSDTELLSESEKQQLLDSVNEMAQAAALIKDDKRPAKLLANNK